MIQTNYGPISGVDMGTYTEYRGIPYAAPPIGPRTGESPHPPPPPDRG